jgi:hypothetical protein
MGEANHIFRKNEREIFSREYLDRLINLRRFVKFDLRRRRFSEAKTDARAAGNTTAEVESPDGQSL